LLAFLWKEKKKKPSKQDHHTKILIQNFILEYFSFQVVCFFKRFKTP